MYRLTKYSAPLLVLVTIVKAKIKPVVYLGNVSIKGRRLYITWNFIYTNNSIGN
jgi:hypothetical protein